MQTEFTNQQLATVRAYLAQVRALANIEKWERVMTDLPIARYLMWVRRASLDAQDIRTALWWYRYRHKPGSAEWRPGIIISVLITASERDYVEPERMPISTVALMTTNNHRKQAHRAFVRKHGVAVFHQRIKPILRRGGVEALFEHPATPEMREYVRILTAVACGIAV